jgi:nitric oxide reductase activation protein
MKTLIIISDGYPQDHDYGRDRSSREYGIEDTTKALAEARQKGIQTFCLTVDQSGHDYLREMCPDNQYMVIRHLDQLPSELSKVYEGLTT